MQYCRYHVMQDFFEKLITLHLAVISISFQKNRTIKIFRWRVETVCESARR